MEKRCDVLIVGSGITGLSCYRHLQKQGVQNLLIANDEAVPAVSPKGSGFFVAGLLDNYTRLSHAHGAEFGESLWRYSIAGFDDLLAYCRETGIAVAQGDHLRLIVSPQEMTEATKATEGLRKFRTTQLKSILPGGNSFAARVEGLQSDPKGAATVAIADLFASLTKGIKYLPKVTRLSRDGDKVRATTSSGEVLAEIVVVAGHLATGTLITELSDSLVSFADQWTEVSFEADLPAHLPPGTFYSVNHTHEWGAVMGRRSMRIGGGRYLRPMAGIEAKEATAEQKIADHLGKKLGDTFLRLPPFKLGASHASLDCRPCDELPIIGPMYGTNRILVATGYMGAGFGLGFKAGASLARLIQKGSCPELPRRLWPERLRSLES